MLVDDDPVDVKYLQMLSRDMQSFQADFVVAHQAEKVAELIDGIAIDLALVDFWLGSVSAVSVIQDLSVRRSVPTVVLTGLDIIDIRESGFQAGALGFLSKHHLSTEALESVISSVLRLHAVELQPKRRFERFSNDDGTQGGLEDWLASMHVRLHDMERSLDPATAGTLDGGDEGTLPAIAAHRLRMEISYLRREIAFGLPLLRGGRAEPDLDLSSFDLVDAVRDAAGEFIDSGGDLGTVIALDETPMPIPIESERAMVTDLIAYLIKTASDELRGPAVVRISVGVGVEGKDAFIVLSQGRSITLPESSAWLKQSRQFSHAGEPSTGAMGQRLQFAANAAMRLGGALDVDGPEKGRKLMVALPTRLPHRASNPGPSS